MSGQRDSIRLVPPQIEPANSVVLLVGREQFTPPSSFGGLTCVATDDCVAIAVGSPTSISLGPSVGTGSLEVLGEFVIETEGLVSLRDVFSREFETMGSPAGPARVTVWGNRPNEPSELVIQVAEVTSVA